MIQLDVSVQFFIVVFHINLKLLLTYLSIMNLF